MKNNDVILSRADVKKGGDTTKERHGREHFVKIGKIRAAEGIKNDPDYYKKLSQAGVEARKRKRAEQKRQEAEKKRPLNKIARLISGN